MGQGQSLPQGPLRRGQIRGSGVKANPVEMNTVRRHMSPGQETKSDLGAEMPVEQRYGPVEHCVHDSSGKKWKRIPAQNYGDYEQRPPWVPSQIRGDGVKSVVMEQRYRPAEHGSKPIPVHDARYYGDN